MKRKIRFDRLLLSALILLGIVSTIILLHRSFTSWLEKRQVVKSEPCLVETWQRQEVETVVKRKLTYLGEFRLTAYCSCPICTGVWSGGPTASGVMPQAMHTIAVDPQVIPLGSRVVIEGFDNEFIAEDTGSAINENKIDIFVNNHDEAYQSIYNRYANVWIIE